MLCSELGHTDLEEHSIEMGAHGLTRQRPYREAVYLWGKINDMVKDMTKCDVIRPSTMCEPHCAGTKEEWLTGIVLIITNLMR